MTIIASQLDRKQHIEPPFSCTALAVCCQTLGRIEKVKGNTGRSHNGAAFSPVGDRESRPPSVCAAQGGEPEFRTHQAISNLHYQ